MKKEFVEPKIDVILLDSEISTSSLLIGGSGDFTDSGDGSGGGL